MLERMEESGHPVSDQGLRALQQELGVRLPDAYKQFLLKYNGGLPAPDSFPISGMRDNPHGIIQEFFGIDSEIESSNLDWNYRILMGRIPSNLFPIACTPSGDVLCLSVSGGDIGAVVLWDFYNEHRPPSYKNVYFVAKSFDDFIENLFRSPESQT